MSIIHGTGVGTGLMRTPNKKPQPIRVTSHASNVVPKEEVPSNSVSPFRLKIRVDSPTSVAKNIKERKKFGSLSPKLKSRTKPNLPKGERNKKYSLDEDEQKRQYENTNDDNDGVQTPVAMATPVLTNEKEGQMIEAINVCYI